MLAPSPVRKWKPAPALAADAFAAAAATLPGVEPRKMFGYACIFAGGRMVAGLHEAGLVLRLPAPDRARFLRLDGATPFEPMPGRVMREYVVAPPGLLTDRRRLRAWLARSLAYVTTLAPKTGARRKTPAKKTAAMRRPRRTR
jgi:TfoX/Sxy family transcriptional regulator of competence genes